MNTLTRGKLKVSEGGLMRCCHEHIQRWIAAAPDSPVAENESITCQFCKAMMIVKHGVLYWDAKGEAARIHTTARNP